MQIFCTVFIHYTTLLVNKMDAIIHRIIHTHSVTLKLWTKLFIYQVFIDNLVSGNYNYTCLTIVITRSN